MKFELLTPGHYLKLKPFFVNEHYPLSIYSLSSLIAWSQCLYDTLFAVDGDRVYISEIRKDDPGRKQLLLPVSSRGAPAPAELRDKALDAGFREYHYVPGNYLQSHGRRELEKHFAVTEQPEYDDYVYRVSDLADLTGRDYAKKRNLARRFERDYVDKGTVSVSPIASANSRDCLECLEGWRAESPEKDWTEVLECERRAITQALEHFDDLEFSGIMVSISGKVRGFGIAERFSNDTGALCFEKASDQVKGLYQFLDRECCRRLFAGKTFVNKESDLGDPGLTKAKQSYHPVSRVKSYKLVLR